LSIPLYLIIDLALCALSILLAIPLYKMVDPMSRKAAFYTFILLCILSSVFQYVCLVRVHAWSVNPEASRIIPLTIAGSPLEEYLFWWPFALLMIEFYLYPKILFSKKESDRSH
jgi:hypothetical protein